MNVKDEAEEVKEALLEEYDDPLLAVGWYSKETEQRTDSVYISDNFGEYEKEIGEGALETAMLESFGHAEKEEIHDERLTTTVRYYETIADIDLHLDEFTGIVVAVRSGDDYQTDEVLRTMIGSISEPVGVTVDW